MLLLVTTLGTKSTSEHHATGTTGDYGDIPLSSAELYAPLL
jgi:hypothetical protein